MKIKQLGQSSNPLLERMLLLKMILPLLFSVLLLVPLSLTTFLDKNNKQYGPYTVFIREFKSVHGPKPKDLTLHKSRLDVKNGEFIAYVNITFLGPTEIEVIKKTLFYVNDTTGTKTQVYKQSINKPCEHYLIGIILKTYLDMNPRNCVAKKGVFTTRVSLTRFMYDYLGPNFYYGSYYVKYDAFNKKGNIYSVIARSQIRK